MLRRSSGRSAVEIARTGFYFNAAGERVEIGQLVARAAPGKQSILPEVPLPNPQPKLFPETRVQVANETTLGTSRRLAENGPARVRSLILLCYCCRGFIDPGNGASELLVGMSRKKQGNTKLAGEKRNG